ncbi:MAG: glycine cleavage system protein GcvH [Thermoleophilia bacterium]
MADESYPQNLRYYKEHDWVRLDGDEATFGITWFAQDSLGEIVYADLPKPGARVVANETYGELESVKAVSELYAPLSGEVIESNAELDDEPAAVNEDCYGKGWLVKVRLDDPAQADELMDAAAYRTFLAEA